MSLHHFGMGALRVAKNYTMGYSHTQMRIRNATCNDPWPPSGKEMYELSQMSYNQDDFVEIMEVIDKRLNDKGKNWRHVFKSLVVLDYLLHSGSENVIKYCEDNLYEIKTLREFQYIDEDGKDQGANVRQKAKDITSLLMDKKRLYEERRIRSRMRDRMLGHSRGTADDEEDAEAVRSRQRRRLTDEAEEELRRAIEESRRTAEQEHSTAEDRDLQHAIQLSQEEEEKRKRALDEANAASLFDAKSNQQPSPTIQTQPLIDATKPLQYTSAGIAPQLTALQPQFTYIQPQFTSFNPYLQQAQEEAMQTEYMRQQAEWARQQELLAQQQQQPMLVPFQTGFQSAPQPITSPLVPQLTAFGSNNPFLAPPPPPTSPASSTFLPQRAASASLASPVSFNLAGTYDGRPRPALDSSSSYPARNAASAPPRALLQPFSTGTEPPQKLGGEREHARLASLFANYTGDGVDTFGNTGQLRFLATQHGRLAVQKTGSGGLSRNPFVHPEQGQPPIVEENLIDI